MMLSLKGISLWIRELADFYRFFWRIPETDRLIVFYTENAGYYPYYEGLVEELIGKYNRTFCYVTSQPDDPMLKQPRPQIRAFYLNKLLALFMAHVNCRVFVMTLTDLNQFNLKRSLNTVHYIYVFHALVSTHMIYRFGAFDYYDTILCCGPHHIKEIRRHEELNSLPPKNLVETGYYRLERIHRAYKKYSAERSSRPAIISVLIAPSWGVANVLESCGDRLVEMLLKAGYEVIVRPHPETAKRTPDLIASLATKFGKAQSFTLELSIATDDSLLKADVLISDYSGIALEYAFGIERPVLFLDVPPKIHNTRYGELGIDPLELSLRSEIGVVVPLEKLDTVPQVVSRLVADRAVFKERIAELRAQNVYGFGHSSDIGAQYIMALVGYGNHEYSQ